MRWIWAVGLLVFTSTLAHARGPGWVLAMPGFRDEGDNITPIKVVIGTTTPTLLASPDLLKNRSLVIMNPSSQYQLQLGTCANFNIIDSYWIVHKNSGTETSYNHQPIWAMYPPGATSETVRGKLEKE